MTPPEAPVVGKLAGAAAEPPAVSVCLTVLNKRADFVRASKAKRIAMPGFVLQARKRSSDEAGACGIRIGYTCSKKVGNAVARNRAKRRLREVAGTVLPRFGRDGWDYVLIGRNTVTAERGFQDLISDLETALPKLHGQTE